MSFDARECNSSAQKNIRIQKNNIFFLTKLRYCKLTKESSMAIKDGFSKLKKLKRLIINLM
jgi:hypothetical protein